LARKPVAIAVPVAEAAPAATPLGTGSPTQSSAGSASNVNALASIDRSTSNSLDALKDQLFRLELRRQAGTISDEEYSRERAKAEQVLRDLVRG
jgi:hypothetical protein